MGKTVAAKADLITPFTDTEEDTHQASLSGTFLDTLPELVMPL